MKIGKATLAAAVLVPVLIGIGSEVATKAPAETGKSEATDGRAALRAFYTAPPEIPHVVLGQGNRQCAYCHSEVRHIGERTSVRTPHIEMSNCQQCHVGPNVLNEEFEVELTISDWLGLEEPRKGSRAFELAPPTIPHRLFMREDCMTCHDPQQPTTGMRVPHPERSNCMQCHVADESQQF